MGFPGRAKGEVPTDTNYNPDRMWDQNALRNTHDWCMQLQMQALHAKERGYPVAQAN